MQIYTCLGMSAAIGSSLTATPDVIVVLPAGLLSVSQIFHYQWSRRWPPPASSVTFGTLDRKDHSAVCLLLASLACGFFMLRAVLYQVLLPMHLDMANSFRCAQSVLINTAAIALMLFAYIRRNREVRNVAILVTIIGAVKVFLYDLLGTHGAPLVASVFSFGTAAAVESVILGRWQRITARDRMETPEADDRSISSGENESRQDSAATL